MLFRLPFDVLVLLIPVLLFSLCFHEFFHAYVAYKLGDDTAERMGRLTLNPLAHIDPMGGLMILFVGFGWAKPVPVNPRNFHNPRVDMMKVALAGPASNILLAFIGGMVFRWVSILHIQLSSQLGLMLYYFTFINIALAVFNMIPVAPLDGSQIFNGLIIRKNPDLAWKLQKYGPQVLYGVIIFGMLTNIRVLWWIMEPVVNLFMYLFAGV